MGRKKFLLNQDQQLLCGNSEMWNIAVSFGNNSLDGKIYFSVLQHRRINKRFHIIDSYTYVQGWI